jgi:hypothetical protein
VKSAYPARHYLLYGRKSAAFFSDVRLRNSGKPRSDSSSCTASKYKRISTLAENAAYALYVGTL